MKSFLLTFVFLISSVYTFSQTLPSKKEIYEVTNQFIHGTDSTYMRLQKSSDTWRIFEDSSSFLSDTARFSAADFDYFRLQLKEIKTFDWNQNRFEKVRTISELRLKWIFRNNRKGWKRFHEKFNKSCLVSCSIPLFTVDKTYCILYKGVQCGGLLGEGSTDIYKLENGKWVYVDSYGMWVS